MHNKNTFRSAIAILRTFTHLFCSTFCFLQPAKSCEEVAQDHVILPSPYCLIREHDNAMLANDAMKPPFKAGGLYYVEWYPIDNPNERGALFIMGSQHNFPIQRLPRAYQRIIYGCNNFDFLFHEISKAIYKESGRLKCNEVLVDKKPSSVSWFNELSINEQETFKGMCGIRDVDELNNVVDKPENIDLVALFLFNLIQYSGSGDYYMDQAAFEHSDKWEGLETEAHREGELKGFADPWAALDKEDAFNAVKAFLSFSPQQCVTLKELGIENPDLDFETFAERLSLTSKQRSRLQKLFDIWAQPDTGEETRKRNLYWWNESFPKIFQRPGKLGLVMFGSDHLWGKHGMMTRIYKAFLKNKSVHGAVIRLCRNLS